MQRRVSILLGYLATLALAVLGLSSAADTAARVAPDASPFTTRALQSPTADYNLFFPHLARCPYGAHAVPSSNQSFYWNHLHGVTATSLDNAWAVGIHNGGKIFMHHWDGMRWTYRPYSNPDEPGDLRDILALSPSDIWAVGSVGGGLRTLAMHWDGVEWSILPTPHLTDYANRLYSISAVDTNDVWAVGEHFKDMEDVEAETLTIHWDGSQWSYVPSHSILGRALRLSDVAAISSDNVWAVGVMSSPVQTLAMRWNGIEWQLVNELTGRPGSLSSVAALGANDIWVAGNERNENVITATIMHWDGTAWKSLSFANESVSKIVARSATDVWAVGTKVRHWDGREWRIIPIEGISAGEARLTDIALLPDGSVWLVGTTLLEPSPYSTTLILRANLPCQS